MFALKLKDIRAILLCALFPVGVAIAESPNSPLIKEPVMTHIQIIIGDEVLAATLDDTPAGKDFAALLPLELTLDDYHQTEKIADLPRQLDTTGSPSSYEPKTGDITYYAPWGNLAIFYKPFQKSSGLIRLGDISGNMDLLRKTKTIAVRIELAKP